MPLLATTPGNRLTIPRISTAGAAPLPSRMVMGGTPCWGRVAGSRGILFQPPRHPVTSVLGDRSGNRFGRDRLEGGQLLLIRRYRDRAVDDRPLIGGDGVEHVLRHRLVRVAQPDAVFCQAQRPLAALECAIDNLLRGQEEGCVDSLLR